MSESHFTLIFDGEAVRNGEIDVRDLAPPLLAVGDMIQRANALINGEKAAVSVKVKATQKGSFEVDLSLVQSLADMATLFFDYAELHKDSVAAANDLLDLIFKVTGVGLGGGGLLALIKWMKGRKPDKIIPNGGEVHVHIGDNIFITDERIICLAEDKAIREQAKKAVSTLGANGINKLSVRRDKAENLEITQEDVPSFEIPETEDEELSDETRRMTLQVIALSFKEDNKWRVTDGGDPFSANITDETFLQQVASDEIAFAKHDYLVCEVREQQFMTASGLKKERTIQKVIAHKPATKQIKLI